MFDPQIVTVEYSWNEVDEKGEETGTQFFFKEDVPQPANAKLILLGGRGSELEDGDLYATWEDMQKTFA